MSRRVFLGALALSVGLTTAALAQSAEDKAKAEAEAAAKLKEAVAACDKGASIPLDPDAKAPAVHYYDELAGDTFDLDGRKALAATCKEAFLGSLGTPDQKRLKLQWLRLAVALRQEADFLPFLADIRDYAAAGSAEANFLLFTLYRDWALSGEGSSPIGIARDEALRALTTAADAGHLQALSVLFEQFARGPYLRRDAKQAAGIAAKLIDLPPQGPPPARKYEADTKAWAEERLATIFVTKDGFSPEEQARGFAIVEKLFTQSRLKAMQAYVTALRYGRGTPADPAKARQILEQRIAANDNSALAILADMLAKGEGGPADGKRALSLLRQTPVDKLPSDAKAVLAGIYLDNQFTGPRPREATRLISDSYDLDTQIRAAGLLLDYHEKLAYPEGFIQRLNTAAIVGEPGAGMALARLKLSDHPQFRDETGAAALLAKLAANGDGEAKIMLAELQYDLDSSGFGSHRRSEDMTDAEMRTTIEEGIADEQASASRLKAKLIRKGIIYPQDDAAATKEFVVAAERGDIEAMILAGEAYDDGLGVKEDSRERLRWWREAAQLGSIEAQEELARAFVFDSFDKLMTLREGITGKLVHYNNGVGEFEGSGGPGDDVFTQVHLGGMFRGGRTDEAGTAALAAAIMDAFRLAPDGLSEKKLLPLMRELDDPLRIEIERVLKAEGFYKGSPDGFFGPEVRTALADWVEAKGPLQEEEPAAEKVSLKPEEDAADRIPEEVITRLREKAFATAREAKTDEERAAAIKAVNLLAQHGDQVSRWAIMTTYHKGGNIQAAVTPEEITRYGLDLVVTRPEGAEKVEFEFIFDVSAIYTAGAIDAFGKSVVDAIRDDVRLQDPLTLGGVMEHINFAPGACGAIAKAAADAGVAGAGDDGCTEAARVALIAFAKEKGPAGIETAAQAAAADEIRKMDGGG